MAAMADEAPGATPDLCLQRAPVKPRLLPYDPNRLLDRVKRLLRLETDSQLARLLGIAPQRVSKIRYRLTPVSAAVLIRMTEVTDCDLPELRRLLGDRRRKHRMGPEHFRPRKKQIPVPSDT